MNTQLTIAEFVMVARFLEDEEITSFEENAIPKITTKFGIELFRCHITIVKLK